MVSKKVYILMATYNGEKYLREQIDSILNQTFKNWILWIHDDNSNDNTISIIKEFRSKCPNKIKFLDDATSTGGAKENFTYLLSHIDLNFDYIMFCDQDDVWLPIKIELTLEKMVETENTNLSKPILLHTDLIVVDENLKTISNSMLSYQKLDIRNQYKLELISLENVVTGCTMMINKKLFDLSHNIPNNAIMHDWWIAIQTLKNSGKIEFIDIGTIKYRQHLNNTIGSKKVNLLYYLKKTLEINKLVSNYKMIYSQLKLSNIKMSFIKFLILKTFMIFKKIVS